MTGTDDAEEETLPSDVAVQLVEALLTPAGDGALVRRERVVANAKAYSDELVGWWVDRVLWRLCARGCVERACDERGRTGYRATAMWGRREEVLYFLRPPRKRKAEPRGRRA